MVNGFDDMARAATLDDALDKKAKELIGLAAFLRIRATWLDRDRPTGFFLLLIIKKPRSHYRACAASYLFDSVSVRNIFGQLGTELKICPARY